MIKIGENYFNCTEQLTPPLHNYCKSGHIIYMYEREPGTGVKPVKWYTVRDADRRVSGVYCEPCLIVARHMSEQQRMKI